MITFSYIVDKTIITLHLNNLKYVKIFLVFYLVLKMLLKEKCLNLDKSLKPHYLLNINEFDLFSKLNISQKIINLENNKLIDIFTYINKYILFF